MAGVRPDLASLDLRAIAARAGEHDGGAVNSSIPALAAADPGMLGIALVGIDGALRSTGDADVAFSLQSAVKPFLFALALADTHGEALDRVGIEPTGEAFDAVKLESGTGRPPNPMVNAGAILTASLVDGDSVDERRGRILQGLSSFAGRQLAVDEEIAEDEHLRGDRNHALAHLMRSEGTLAETADDAVAVYAAACAVMVDVGGLAVMGATLANNGANPVTGEQVVSPRIARDVVSVMATCGVYDGSGRWMRSVGIPAKSSVSGALVLSSPGVLGAGVISPPLDEQGTSVRGHVVADILSAELGLHAFGRC
ncbi:glutaminase A [Microbacterium sp. EYE_5]|uniref:glutaminase A n=1 Tax=unclassified Microbacterium TaxID=2609290 RepID=UPI00200539C2|nr:MULTISPECIES: glutaminase A [unclassified Microbacterium]MCK6080651.1 glutaminase A [Microbacterium sp. EYE_382]MCK6085922.1 glutaminase A [Microbacterium sp. EYE_384]MCK6124580.1 glutaminase A [Microbacterium sp. EYE_80]MCK6127489.1 glutaminase A [Microbacterium sp. EYE_79]MCK6141606.1 glutaminase A [Microbacterium sp. EYE_39]